MGTLSGDVDLAEAEQHIADARQSVARQREVIKRIKASGGFALDEAEMTLMALIGRIEILQRSSLPPY
jgi:hypothetical protein